jgi:hypothetical protein
LNTGTLDGKIQETIIYPSVITANRTDIEGNISAYYQSAKLLDEQFGENAEAAYSTRQLRRAQTDCMVIRRASDSTTQTIGFDANGNIDESAINTFCSGTSCTVYQWLDQSGNGNTATAAAQANEPTIYTGGALVKQDGRVGVDFDGSTNVLVNTTVSVTDYDFSIVNVNVHPTTSGVPSGLYLSTSSNTYYQHLAVGGTGTLLNRIQARVGATTGQGFTDAIEGQRNLNYLNFISATSRDITVNGVESGSNNTNVTFTAPNSFSIGAMNDSSPANYLDAIVQEVILYGATKSSADQTSVQENIGDYFTQNTPLLDTYSGAAACYSLRLMRTAYTGALIRVRRSSDNTELDINANVFGELDTVSLLDFAGTGDAFCKVWYDQSGNANDATQTTTANQPKIVSSGAVIVENGKPAVEFDGSNDQINLASYPFTGTDISVFSIVKTSETVAGMNAYSFGDASNIFSHTFNRSSSSTWGVAYSTTGPQYRQGDTYNQAQSLFTQLNTGTTTTGYRDGTQGTQSNLCFGSFSQSVIGSKYNGNYLNGTIQEVVIYDSNKSTDRTNIESNINTFYSIY